MPELALEFFNDVVRSDPKFAVAFATSGACGDQALPEVPTIFSADEAGLICVTLQACFPAEWQGPAWGGSLFACTSDRGYVPQPGTLARDPYVVWGFEAAFTRLYRCILVAGGDCAAAAACLAPDGVPGTCPPDGLEHGACTGAVLAGCTADGFVFANDCAADGEICGEYPAIFASFNGCVFPCPAQLGCSGTWATACWGTAMVRADCAALGAVCVDGACVPSEPPRACDPDGQHCDGSVRVECASDGTETRFDCAVQPTRRRCVVEHSISGRPYPECAPTGTDCAGSAQHCDGDDVVYCRDGWTARQSCQTAGFSGCRDGGCAR